MGVDRLGVDAVGAAPEAGVGAEQAIGAAVSMKEGAVETEFVVPEAEAEAIQEVRGPAVEGEAASQVEGLPVVTSVAQAGDPPKSVADDLAEGGPMEDGGAEDRRPGRRGERG
jgi:hypothetical protein